MKLVIIVLSLVATIHGQQLPGMDIPGAVLAQVSTLTRQVNGIQSILQELNGQFSRMVATGTRMVAGLQAEGGAPNPLAALISPISSVTEQMASFQRTLSDISNQVSRMITSASRIATGNPSLYQDSQTNYAETFIRTLTDVSKQLSSTANILRDMSNSWNRVIESSSRLVAGLEGESSSQPAQPSLPSLPSSNGSNPMGQITAPAEAFIKGIGSATEQLSQVQRVATDMSNELSKMLASGTRVFTGDNRDGTGNPTDAAISTLTGLTRQFGEIQNVLRSLNEQFNRMVSSGTRVISGGGPRVRRQTGLPTDTIMQSLSSITQQLASAQRVLTELNASFSRMISSSSRLLG